MVRLTRAPSAVVKGMRDTLPVMQSTIEQHIGRHQGMVQVHSYLPPERLRIFVLFVWDAGD